MVPSSLSFHSFSLKNLERCVEMPVPQFVKESTETDWSFSTTFSGSGAVDFFIASKSEGFMIIS